MIAHILAFRNSEPAECLFDDELQVRLLQAVRRIDFSCTVGSIVLTGGLREDAASST